MVEESRELIEKNYDNRDGLHEIAMNIRKTKNRKNVKLLDLTNLKQKIKLKQMTRTWESTRTVPMILRNVETMFYILISSTHWLVYIAMIRCMYENAGFISIFYPIAVFGYALLEESRPVYQFWSVVRKYTEVILVIKFITSIRAVNDLMI